MGDLVYSDFRAKAGANLVTSQVKLAPTLEPALLAVTKPLAEGCSYNCMQTHHIPALHLPL